MNPWNLASRRCAGPQRNMAQSRPSVCLSGPNCNEGNQFCGTLGQLLRICLATFRSWQIHADSRGASTRHGLVAFRHLSGDVVRSAKVGRRHHYSRSPEIIAQAWSQRDAMQSFKLRHQRGVERPVLPVVVGGLVRSRPTRRSSIGASLTITPLRQGSWSS